MELTIFYSLFITLTGFVLGSFYACSIVRYCSNSPILTRRSKCVHCGHTLYWYNLIPVVSFLFQRGQCSFCHKTISFFYPLIECLFGIASLLTYLKFGLCAEFFFYLLAVHFILIASIIDFKLFIIPCLFTVYAFILFAAAGYALKYLSPANMLSSLLCFAVFFLCYEYFLHIRKLEALGFGDVKFVLFLGLFFLPQDIPYFFLISSVLAICYTFFRSYKDKTNIYKTKIPFGPFLGTAALILLLY